MPRKVQPGENNGGVRIRFVYQGRRFNLTLNKLVWNVKADRALADAIASLISADINARQLDTTLKKYRALLPSPPPVEPASYKDASTLELWDDWVASRELSDYAKAGHYYTTRRAIERGDLFKKGLSAFTHNLRRRQINRVYEFAIDKGLATHNPYENIRVKRAAKKGVQVFSVKELQRIVATIDEHWPCYSQFVRFLIVSGCRFGEAAGVVGRNIDIERGVIHISTSVRFNIDTKQIELRGGNKTETYRELESPQLIEIVQAQSIPVDPSEPVFKSQKGKLIRRNVFTQIVWKPALKLAKVPYRKIHTLRHTALSMALKALSVPDVAYLAGHRDSTMIVRTYGHIIDRPELPPIDIDRSER